MSKPVCVRVLLFEGDPALRDHLERLLHALGDVSVEWSGADAHAAATFLRRDSADLLFLGADALSLPQFSSDSELFRGEQPAVVVVASNEGAAVRAFAIRAVDYLLSPLTPERVAEAVERGGPGVRPGCPRRSRKARLAPGR